MANEDKDSKGQTGGGPGGRSPLRWLCGALVVQVVVLAALVGTAYRAPSPGTELRLDDFYRLAARNQLKSVKFLDEDAVVVGERCLAPGLPAEIAADQGPTLATPRPPRCRDVTERFHSAYPHSDVATQQLLDAVRTLSGADITVDKQEGVAVAKHVVTFVLPLLLLANLFGIIVLGRGGGDGAVSAIARFGRLGRKRRGEKVTTGVSFADVAGADEAVAELREVIDYLTNPARFEALGAAPPKGVLLFGPPGCGKTLLARATAGESGVPFFSVSGTEFVESLVGVGAARVRDLFRQVREVAPAIVFIDEIDAVGRRRSGEGTSGGEREQTLNQLLVELDGFEVTAGIVLMGATNRPDILDPALMRPGRFDRHITLEPPDVHGREAILQVHARGRPIGPDVDFDLLAQRTPGFTGADLANVINEAALLAIRGGTSQISAGYLVEAVLRVLHGPQRRGKLMQPEERRRLAYHEAGHAVVGAATERGRDLQRVSIVARGRSLGQALGLDEGERVLLTASELHGALATAMAGIAAEVLVFGEESTVADHDLDRANTLAKEIAGFYGMSPELGRLRILTQSGDGYLGSGLTMDLVSGSTMAEFEREVSRLLVDAERRASAHLVANRPLLDSMAAALERDETLEGEALTAFLSRVRREQAPANGSPRATRRATGRPVAGGEPSPKRAADR